MTHFLFSKAIERDRERESITFNSEHLLFLPREMSRTEDNDEEELLPRLSPATGEVACRAISSTKTLPRTAAATMVADDEDNDAEYVSEVVSEVGGASFPSTLRSRVIMVSQNKIIAHSNASNAVHLQSSSTISVGPATRVQLYSDEHIDVEEESMLRLQHCPADEDSMQDADAFQQWKARDTRRRNDPKLSRIWREH